MGNEGSSSTETAEAVWWQIGAKGALATLVIAVLYLVSVDWQLPFPRDVVGYAIGRDFLNLWTMGLEAWGDEPSRFYDMSAYSVFISDLLGKDYPYQQWSYPPNSLLLGAPFGLLPYLSAFCIWTLAGLGLFAYAVTSAGWTASPKLLLLLLASPSAVVCLISGQNAFLTGAAFVLIYRFWDTRPVLAGIVIGCLTLKPQLGVLLPFALLASRRWTVFMSAACTTLAIAGITALLFGPEVWKRYFTVAVGAQESGVLDNPSVIIQGFMPTVYMNLRLVGVPADGAYLAQAFVALCTIGAICWCFYQRRDPELSFALLVVCTALATPYLMIYDLVIFSFVLLLLADRLGNDRLVFGLMTAFFWLPLITFTAGVSNIPGSALIPVLAAVWILRSLWRESKVVELSGVSHKRAAAPA